MSTGNWFDYMPELGDPPTAELLESPEFRPSVTTVWAPAQRKPATRADETRTNADATRTNADETQTGARLESGELAFILGGKAYVTLRSVKTGTRFTYRVERTENGGGWFVSLLVGPDNWANYKYIGLIGGMDRRFRTTKKSTQPASAPSVRAFAWTFARLVARQDTSGVEIWHNGKCGRCGRMLTVPESIASGIGPECAKRAA